MNLPQADNILYLGVKELRGLARDRVMLVLIGYTFTFAIYISATAKPEILHNTTIAIVDEDGSTLSTRIASAFFSPHFRAPAMISLADTDVGMDTGIYTFVIDIPPDFQRDVLAEKVPAIQLNVDATQISQAFSGSNYVQQIAQGEIDEYIQHVRLSIPPPVELVLRARFNPNLQETWFGAVVELMNNVTMLSIILTGAALIREREHGTIEHLLAMPVTPTEIMVSKVWSMGLVVLTAASFAMIFIVQGLLRVPLEGSMALFLAGAAVHVFAVNSMAIFMATQVRSMPQFGLFAMLVLLPLQLLSGNITPRESMPQSVQYLMLVAPTTHFVELGKAILFRGAGIDVVWPQFLALGAIAAVFFTIAMNRFYRTINQTN